METVLPAYFYCLGIILNERSFSKLLQLRADGIELIWVRSLDEVILLRLSSDRFNVSTLISAR